MIVYFSGATGFTHKFVEKLDVPSERIPLKIKEAESFTVDEDFVLIVPTYEIPDTHGRNGGETSYLPRQVAVFLNQPENRKKMKAVIGTGNRNFHTDFARSAETVSEKTGVPILYRLELSGTDKDIETVKEGLIGFWETIRSVKKPQQS